MAVFDISDYKDQSSLSGTSSRHYTASVIYQEVIENPKPPVSSTNIRKSDRPRKNMLSCQEVTEYFKHVIRHTLPPGMLLEENANNLLIHNRAEKALTEARWDEFLISFFRVGLPYSQPNAGQPPPWGRIHALISKANVPVMRVGLLPVIPRPVTKKCTVRKNLQNF